MFFRIWIVVLLLSAAPFAASAGEILLTSGSGEYSLAPSLKYLVDDKGELHFENILDADFRNKFTENRQSALNFGFSEKTYWVSFSFTGTMTSSTGWYLELQYPAIDSYTLYVPDMSGGYIIKDSGDKYDFAEWDVPVFRPVMFLGNTLDKEKTFYLRVKTTGIVNIAPVLWTGAELTGHMADLSISIGVYYGLMGALALYNLFIFLVVRDRDYLLYVLYIATFALSQFTYNGLGFRYIWPETGWFTNFSYPFFMGIVFVPMLLFSRSFLRIGKHLPGHDRLLKFIMFLYVFLSVSEPFLGMKTASGVVSTLGIAVVISVYYCAFRIFRMGERSARFFLIGWSAYTVGIIIFLVKNLGILPHNGITEYSMQAGSALEGILFSMALADRINILKEEKNQAQSRALTESVRAADMQSKFLAESEKLVEERTKELTIAKNELEKLAKLDKLTELYNRREFDDVYSTVYAHAARSGIWFSLLMIDVDFFKRYNDLYGHQMGDKCLVAVADCIRRNAQRITDTAARYGGEEFIVILADTDRSNAFKIADRIKHDVQALGILHESSPFGVVTVSVGVAVMDDSFEGPPEKLIQTADQAMYRSKDAGRNRVTGA